MDLAKHTFIFETIAPVYNWFFNSQNTHYSEILSKYSAALNLSPDASILDIGCGTGAFAKAFKDMGFSVFGVDISRNMIRYGVKRGLDCRYGNALGGLDYSDKMFDMVVFAYVAHGLDSEKRRLLFIEASRLAKKKVLIHDYGAKRKLATDIIEFLEGGDYFNFIKSGVQEMKDIFADVSIITVDDNASWYICTPG